LAVLADQLSAVGEQAIFLEQLLTPHLEFIGQLPPGPECGIFKEHPKVRLQVLPASAGLVLEQQLAVVLQAADTNLGHVTSLCCPLFLNNSTNRMVSSTTFVETVDCPGHECTSSPDRYRTIP